MLHENADGLFCISIYYAQGVIVGNEFVGLVIWCTKFCDFI